MELMLLTVPDCPNASAFEERLAAGRAAGGGDPPRSGGRRARGGHARVSDPAGQRHRSIRCAWRTAEPVVPLVPGRCWPGRAGAFGGGAAASAGGGRRGLILAGDADGRRQAAPDARAQRLR